MGITAEDKHVASGGRLSFICFAVSSVEVTAALAQLRRATAACKLAARKPNTVFLNIRRLNRYFVFCSIYFILFEASFGERTVGGAFVLGG